MAGLGRVKSEFKSDKFDFTLDVTFQLEAFREYLKVTQDQLENEINSKINEYRILEKNNDMFIDYGDYEIKLNILPLYYNSLFVSLFSFLEKKLYQLCKIAESKQTIKLNDMSGKGVEKYKKYLMLVVKIDFDKLNTEWSYISKLSELRNLIVHNPTTEVDQNNNSKLVITLKSIDYLRYKVDDEIYNFYIENTKLLTEFSGTISRFLENIYMEYN